HVAEQSRQEIQTARRHGDGRLPAGGAFGDAFIQRLVDQGVAEGATCWQPSIPMPSRGLYFLPTLLSNVHPTSVVAQQEIFGPVLAAMTFRTPREAVELANNTVY